MCNCGKKTPPPPPPPPPTTPAQDQLASRAQTFSYQPPSGKIQTFGSRLEADAARVRAGRVGRVIPGGSRP